MNNEFSSIIIAIECLREWKRWNGYGRTNQREIDRISAEQLRRGLEKMREAERKQYGLHEVD